MSKTISSLSVILGATVAPLVSAFKTAETASTSLVSSLSSIASPLAAIGGIGAALGGVIGGAGLGILVKDQSAAIDSTAKLSDRLGVSTEAIAGFQHAGNLAGVSTEQLTGGLEKMLKNIGEAATAGGPAADAFKSMGLNINAIKNQRPEDTFLQLSDALTKIQNPAARAFEATQIFGKAGQELLPLMMSGAAGIRAASDEAKLLGLTFNRLDAAKVEQANDAMTRVGEAVLGVGRQIVIAIAPAIETAANLMTGWGESMVSVVQTYLPGISNVAAVVFGEASAIAGTAWNAIYGFIAQVGPVATSAFDSVYNAVSTAGEAIYGFIAPIATAWVQTDNLKATAEVLGSVAATVAAGFVAWEAAAGAVTAVQLGLTAATAAYEIAVTSVTAVNSVFLGVQWGAAAAIGAVTTAKWLAVAAYTAGGTVIATVTAATEGMTAASLAWSAITGTVTAAQWLLNAALTANPIGLAVVAVGGLVAGLGILAAKFVDVGAVVNWAKGAFDTAIYAVTHWQESLKLAGAEVSVFAVRTASQIRWAFTEVLPSVLKWVGTNWSDLFTTIGNFTAAVFTNMGKNVGNFASALFGFLKGDGFNFQWTGLTKGFESTLTSLPKIAERHVGPLEQSLSAAADAAMAKFKDGMNGHADHTDIAKPAADATKGAFAGALDWVHDLFKNAHFAIPTPKINPPTPFDINTGPAKKSLDGVKEKAESLKPVMAGSAEAMQMQFAAAAEAVTIDTSNIGQAVQQVAAAPVAAPLPMAAVTASAGVSDGESAKVVALLEKLVTLFVNTPADVRALVAASQSPDGTVSI